jgi:hypothetical protein
MITEGEYKNLILSIGELTERVLRLEQRMEMHSHYTINETVDECCVCGERLPSLGEEGHNVRYSGGREQHYCDEHF